MNVLRDRSEQKLATAALRGSQRNIRLDRDSMIEGFYAVDTDGVSTLCNAAFVRMMGFAREDDAIGRKLRDIVHHHHPDGSPYGVADFPISIHSLDY
ncbi:PAS domain-containing protein [Sphingomonas glacialis]|uniref:PAS domain-containing protein n=1 Tax=Sphingomonas glacialis TaxID=658225 RepID=UPI001125ECAB|nr:PAS domain-containing protein [Sphingomonas glacialis]